MTSTTPNAKSLTDKMKEKIEENYSLSNIVDLNEETDPTVKTELDILNQSAMNINRLEKELDEARSKYQSTFVESAQQIELLKKKYGSSIKRARPYYELKEIARKTQNEALRSARKFQSSNSMYMAAKKEISLAELHLVDDKAICLPAAWREMINHAVSRVTEAEKEKSVSEEEHLKHSAAFADVENKLQVLERKHKSSIAKTRLYFETKKELELKLQQLKLSLEDLQKAMHESKQHYSCALKSLENISNNIHEKRCQKVLPMFPREPGVGAEDIKTTSEFEQKFYILPTPDDIPEGLYDSGSANDGTYDADYAFSGNIFQDKILTASFDDDQVSLKTSKSKEQLWENMSMKRTQSLPAFPSHMDKLNHRVSKQCKNTIQHT